jgi:hypothetical protein
MNEKIRELMAQITALEDEIEDILRSRREKVLYHIKDGRIRFRHDIEEKQRQIKQNVLNWILESRPESLLSVPFIYGMIVPFVIFDLSITLYQWICFPLYRINRVKRGNYIVIDRHHLQFLNGIERLNCTYCSYANGLLAYSREIASRTEQYWCPIKHARKIIDSHSRYHNFIDFGDADSYQEKLAAFQRQVGEESEDKIS